MRLCSFLLFFFFLHVLAYAFSHHAESPPGLQVWQNVMASAPFETNIMRWKTHIWGVRIKKSLLRCQIMFLGLFLNSCQFFFSPLHVQYNTWPWTLLDDIRAYPEWPFFQSNGHTGTQTAAWQLSCQSARKCHWKDVGCGGYERDETYGEDFYPDTVGYSGRERLSPGLGELYKLDSGFCNQQLRPNLFGSLKSGQWSHDKYLHVWTFDVAFSAETESLRLTQLSVLTFGRSYLVIWDETSACKSEMLSVCPKVFALLNPGGGSDESPSV